MTCLLDSEHGETLISAMNLAVSLWHCSRKTEAEQLLRETLALSRCALDPTHEKTQIVLQNMRALGLVAR